VKVGACDVDGRLRRSFASAGISRARAKNTWQTSKRTQHRAPPLTTREHLELYTRIKGVFESKLRATVDEALRRMGLAQVANKKVGTLSGGNKRKPALVLLGEPSTGMDPVARRFMWNDISRIAAVKQTSVTLTSHAMEAVYAL